MKTERIQTVFFFIVLLGCLALVLALAYPFLGALTISLALAVTFRPLFRYFVNVFSGRRHFAAWTTVIVILLLVIIPLSFLGAKIFNEISDLYLAYMTGSGEESNILDSFSVWANGFLGRYLPGVMFDFGALRQKMVEWLFTNLNSIFSSAIKILFNLFIIFITIFYLFKDGHIFKKALRRLSPLKDSEDKAILDRLELTIGSVVKGTIVIAFVQGILAGLGFSIFSVPQPVLWAVVAMIAAIIPGLGTALVFVPLVIYSAVTGSYGAAIGLTIWGTVVVGLVDNFIRPFLLERDIKIHPLLIFLSVLGGLSVFGALGFILGPIILSVAFSLGHIYLAIIEKND